MGQRPDAWKSFGVFIAYQRGECSQSAYVIAKLYLYSPDPQVMLWSEYLVV